MYSSHCSLVYCLYISVLCTSSRKNLSPCHTWEKTEHTMLFSEMWSSSLSFSLKTRNLLRTFSGMHGKCRSLMGRGGRHSSVQSRCKARICGVCRWVQLQQCMCINHADSMQSEIPEGGIPLGIYLYADKNNLSSFGSQKGYPVVMRITNLEAHVRHGRGLGGGYIVGFLPYVSTSSIFLFMAKSGPW